MPYEKRYRTIVPILKGLDRHTAQWLARESFEKRATSDGLELVEYSERDVPVDEIPPKVMEQLGRPLTDYDFIEFSGLGRLNQELFDWLSAECAWTGEQIRQWLAAEHHATLVAQQKVRHASRV